MNLTNLTNLIKYEFNVVKALTEALQRSVTLVMPSFMLIYALVYATLSLTLSRCMDPSDERSHFDDHYQYALSIKESNPALSQEIISYLVEDGYVIPEVSQVPADSVILPVGNVVTTVAEVVVSSNHELTPNIIGGIGGSVVNGLISVAGVSANKPSGPGLNPGCEETDLTLGILKFVGDYYPVILIILTVATVVYIVKCTDAPIIVHDTALDICQRVGNSMVYKPITPESIALRKKFACKMTFENEPGYRPWVIEVKAPFEPADVLTNLELMGVGLIMVLGFLGLIICAYYIYGYYGHFFSRGLKTWVSSMVATLIIGVPTGFKIFSGLATLYGGRIVVGTSLSLVLGFIISLEVLLV